MGVSFLMFGAWRFVHSKTFASILTSQTRKIISKKIHADVKFEKVSLEIFPPGVSLKNVSFLKEEKELQLEVRAGRLSVFFNMFDAFNNKLSFKEVQLLDSVVSLETPPLSVEKQTETISFSYLKNQLSKLPVDIESIGIENSVFNYGPSHLEVERFKIGFDKKAWDGWFSFLNIKTDKKFLANLDDKVDQVKGYVILNQEGLKVRELELKHKFHKLNLKGLIQNVFDLKKANLNLELETSIYLKDLENFYNSNEVLKIQKGFFFSNSNIKGLLHDFQVESSVEIKDFESNLFDADSFKTELEYKKNKLFLKKLVHIFHDQKVELEKNEYLLYDFVSQKIASTRLQLNAKNVDAYNALKFLNSTLYPFKANIDGNFSVEYRNRDIILLSSGLTLHNFEISGGRKRGDSVVLSSNSVLLENPRFIIGEDFVDISSSFQAGENKLNIQGRIGNGEVDFSTKNANISFEDILGIQGVNIKGKGVADISIKGPYENVWVKMQGMFQETSFIGYNLGSSSLNMGLSFKDKLINFDQLTGKIGDTLYFGAGNYFYNTNEVNFKINIPQTNFQDMKFMYKPLMDPLDWLPKDLTGLGQMNYEVKGRVDKKLLFIKGDFSAHNLTLYSENLQKIKMNFSLDKGILKMNNIKANKNSGQLDGFFQYDLEQSSFLYNLKVEGLRLTDSNIAKSYVPTIDGVLDGFLRGENKNFHELDSHFSLSDSTVAGVKVASSSIDLSKRKDIIKYKFNYLGRDIVSEGFFTLNSDNKKLDKSSFINLDLNILDVKLLLTSILGEHVFNTDLKGSINASLESFFDLNDLTHLELKASLLNLKLSMNNLTSENVGIGEIIISNGKISQWTLNIVGELGEILSSGNGLLSDQYQIKTPFKLKANLLSLLSGKIEKIDGAFEGELVFSHKYDLGLALVCFIKDVDFNYEGLPTFLERINGKLFFDGSRMFVEKLDALVGGGKISITGDIIARFPIPQVNLSYQMNDAVFFFLNKSNFVYSGKGNLTGSKLPYKLSGDLSMIRGDLKSEFNEMSDSKDFSLEDVRFLPHESSSDGTKIITLDINVKTISPFLVVNSMVTMPLVGDIRVLGNILSPNLSGRMNVESGAGKFYFKNNEFVVSKGQMYFSESSREINPELDFVSSAIIDEYNVTMRITGNAKNFQIGLTSDPPLSRKDILSLIAFGYTDEQAKDLSGGARSELSSVGVGVLLFESFKVNQALKNEFGLKLNVGTAIEESSDSFLGGTSSGDGSSSVGRVRSATKIEVQKRLNDAMNLSVSSTVGGTIGQRQSMNLNYKINDTVSVEGVYETRSNEEAEEDIVNNSVGVDLKFRWSKK